MVSGWNSDSSAILVLFVNPLAHSSSVIGWDSSILHEFNASWLKSGSSLRSVVGDVENSRVVSGLHQDTRLNWIVVTCDVLVCISKRLAEVPCWSIIENSLLIFKSIGVSIEGLVVVKVVYLPFGDNLVSVILNLWE